MSRKNVSDFDVVVAYAQAKSKPNSGWPYEILAKITGEPEKVCLAACVRAFERGLIDYGVSLRAGWLTEKGLELHKCKPEAK